MKAWQYERKKRDNAQPIALDEAEEGWSGFSKMMKQREEMLKMFWQSRVPGSKAPEALYIEMIQAWSNRGYDVSSAENYIETGLEALENENLRELEIISARVLKELREAPKDEAAEYWKYENPVSWEEVLSSMQIEADYSIQVEEKESRVLLEDREKIFNKILKGWQAQIAGGAYGTALEGYTGEVLNQYYGDSLDFYVAEPETYNDDITFQIAYLKALEENGEDISAADIADKWLELIPFAWSAEYIALENLKRGIYPPESGNFDNFFSEWIGSQMRTMVCGFTAPAQPLKAAYYAYLDSSVSHHTNGIYGGIHSAVMTSLAFKLESGREILSESLKYIPQKSEFYHYLELVLKECEKSSSAAEVWSNVKDEFKKYNWIHVYPNMAAVVISLYFADDDIENAFRILADCGLDIDCNAGEVGSILGVLGNKDLPEKWLEPFGDQLKTYLPGYEEMSIKSLAEWTFNSITDNN